MLKDAPSTFPGCPRHMTKTEKIKALGNCICPLIRKNHHVTDGDVSSSVQLPARNQCQILKAPLAILLVQESQKQTLIWHPRVLQYQGRRNTRYRVFELSIGEHRIHNSGCSLGTLQSFPCGQHKIDMVICKCYIIRWASECNSTASSCKRLMKTRRRSCASL